MGIWSKLFSFGRPPKEKAPLLGDAQDQPLAISADALAGSMPVYDDPPKKLASDAYQRIRRTDVTAQPMNKLAKRVGMMKIVAVGTGEHARAVQERLDQACGSPDMLEWLSWARVEGWRACLMRGKKLNGMIVPDFRGGGRQRVEAGGTYRWDGWGRHADHLVKVREVGGLRHDAETQKAKTLDRWRYIMFRPGGGINPNGDVELAYNLFLLAEAASELDKAQRVYAERHALPIEVLRKLTSALPPTDVERALTDAAKKVASANARQILALPMDDALKLLEPSGTTWQFLQEYRRQLESRANKLILDEDLTGDGGASGPSASNKTAEKMLDTAAFYIARQLSGALTTELYPFIVRTNPDMPKRLPTEPPVRLELRPGKDRGRVKPGELVQFMQLEMFEFDTEEVFEILGMTKPAAMPETIDTRKKESEKKEPPPMIPGMAPGMGMTEEGMPRRGDRPLENDPSVPEEPVLRQNPLEDIRNIKKE